MIFSAGVGVEVGVGFVAGAAGFSVADLLADDVARGPGVQRDRDRESSPG
ncbi:hypothetical protein ACIQU4_20130 [Streptomyces sp. NPDC090741]